MELIPKSIFCKYIKLILHFVCKVIMPILHKMIILRVLVRLYMIFMVWPVVEPKRWGCWAYGRVFWGGLRIIPTGYLGNNKALQARGRVRHGRTIGSVGMDEMAIFAEKNAQCGTGSAGFYLGRFEAKGILLVCDCWRVLCQPWASHDDGFSSSFR